MTMLIVSLCSVLTVFCCYRFQKYVLPDSNEVWLTLALRVIAPYRLIDTLFVKNLIRVRGQKFDDVKFPL